MHATAQQVGKILRRNQIYDPRGNLPKGTYPCICIQIRGQWKWQRLDKLSQQKFHEHRTALSQQIFSVGQGLPSSLPIEIKNAYGEHIFTPSHINGRWLPQSHEKKEATGEYQVYKHETASNLWLYQIESNGRWWIGTQANMKRRKPWGWARSERRSDVGNDGSILRGPPWDMECWKIFAHKSGENSQRWHVSEHITITALSNKHCVQKEIDERIHKIEVRFEHKLNEASQKCEMYNKLLHLMFNDLTREKRQELLSSPIAGNFFQSSHLCSVCLCKPEKIIKCVHFDCVGACQACHDLHDTDTKCGACGKDQHMDCPICMERYLPNFMNILPCKHAVCWKCTCRGYETKKPLNKCPICRHSLAIK
tara:strand:- start:1792 stop:2889 length:1098 start_codon:yes stop_codon:yes gene_type:complete